MQQAQNSTRAMLQSRRDACGRGSQSSTFNWKDATANSIIKDILSFIGTFCIYCNNLIITHYLTKDNMNN